MFERLLVFFLKKFLGEFFEDGTLLSEKVQLGIWKGSLVLEKLVFSKKVLDLSDVPLSLHYGSVGRLEISIPWKRLGLAPIVVSVDSVCVVLEPNYEWDVEATERRQQAIKQAKLAAAETFAQKRLNFADPLQWFKDNAFNWVTKSILSKLIETVHVSVTNVHVRIEDHISCPTSYSCGFMLESFKIGNPDEEDDDDVTLDSNREGDNALVVKKQVNVKHVAAYWNPLKTGYQNICIGAFAGRPPREIEELAFRVLPRLSYEFADSPHHHYILSPANIETTLCMAVDPIAGSINVDVKILVPSLKVTVEDAQLQGIIVLASNIGNFAQLAQYSKYRPSGTVSDDPRAWWQYAIKSIVDQFRAARRSLHSKRSAQYRKHKFVYIEIWGNRLVNQKAFQAEERAYADDLHDRKKRRGRKATIEILRDLQIEASLESGFDADGHDEESEYLGYADKAFMRSDLYTQLLSASMHRREGGTADRDGKLSPMYSPKKKSEGESETGGKSSLRKGEKTSSPARPRKNLPYREVDRKLVALLRKLEEELSFEQIVYFRSLAERDVSVEQAPRGWLESVVSWAADTFTGGVHEEEQQKLFEALQNDPQGLLSADDVSAGLPSASVPLNRAAGKKGGQRIVASVSTYVKETVMSLALSESVKNRPHKPYQVPYPFVIVRLDGLQANAAVNEELNVQVVLSLQDMGVVEVIPPKMNKQTGARLTGMTYNRILSRRALANTEEYLSAQPMSYVDDASSVLSQQHHRAATSRLDNMVRSTHTLGHGNATDASDTQSQRSGYSHKSSRIQSSSHVHHTSKIKTNAIGIDRLSAAQNSPPLLTTELSLSLTNPEAPIELNFRLDQLEVMLCPTSPWIDNTIKFIEFREEVIYWAEVELAAFNQMDNYDSRIDAKLEYMMKEHLNIMIYAWINSPIILIHDGSKSPDPFDSKGGVAGAMRAQPGGHSNQHTSKTFIALELDQVVIHTERLAKVEHMESMRQMNAMDMSSIGGESEYGEYGSLAGYSQAGYGMGSMGQGPAWGVPQTPQDSLMMGPGLGGSVLGDRDRATSFLRSRRRTSTVTADAHGDNAGGGGFGARRVSRLSSVSSIRTAPVPASQAYHYGTPNGTRSTANMNTNAYSHPTMNSSGVYSHTSPGIRPSYYSPDAANNHTNNMPTSDGKTHENHMNGEAADTNSVLYDVLQLSATKIEVYLLNTSHGGKVRERFSIVEKFDINAEIQISALILDPSLPPIKMMVNLPQLTVVVSDSKALQLISFAKNISDNAATAARENEEETEVVDYSIAISPRKGTSAPLSPLIESPMRSPGKVCGDRIGSTSPIMAVRSGADDDMDFFDAVEDYDPSRVFVPLTHTARQDSNSSLSPFSSRVASAMSGGIDDACSDASIESFESVGETPLSMNELHFRNINTKMKMVEADRAKVASIMIDLDERGNSKSRTYRKLEKRLRKYDEDLRDLKTEFVELSIQVQEQERVHSVSRSASTSPTRKYNGGSKSYRGSNGYVEGGFTMMDPMSEECAEVYAARFEHHRRLMKKMLFKSRPKHAKAFGASKKELVHASLSIDAVSVVISSQLLAQKLARDDPANVYDAGTPDRDSPLDDFEATELDVFRLRVTGIASEAQIRMNESKLSLSVGDLSIEDCLQRVVSDDHVDEHYLLSVVKDFYHAPFADLKYECSTESHVSTVGNAAEQESDGEDDREQTAMETVITKHSLRSTIALLSVHIAPSTVAQVSEVARHVFSAVLDAFPTVNMKKKRPSEHLTDQEVYNLHEELINAFGTPRFDSLQSGHTNLNSNPNSTSTTRAPTRPTSRRQTLSSEHIRLVRNQLDASVTLAGVRVSLMDELSPLLQPLLTFEVLSLRTGATGSLASLALSASLEEVSLYYMKSMSDDMMEETKDGGPFFTPLTLSAMRQRRHHHQNQHASKGLSLNKVYLTQKDPSADSPLLYIFCKLENTTDELSRYINMSVSLAKMAVYVNIKDVVDLVATFSLDVLISEANQWAKLVNPQPKPGIGSAEERLPQRQKPKTPYALEPITEASGEQTDRGSVDHQSGSMSRKTSKINMHDILNGVHGEVKVQSDGISIVISAGSRDPHLRMHDISFGMHEASLTVLLGDSLVVHEVNHEPSQIRTFLQWNGSASTLGVYVGSRILVHPIHSTHVGHVVPPSFVGDGPDQEPSLEVISMDVNVATVRLTVDDQLVHNLSLFTIGVLDALPTRQSSPGSPKKITKFKDVNIYLPSFTRAGSAGLRISDLCVANVKTVFQLEGVSMEIMGAGEPTSSQDQEPLFALLIEDFHTSFSMYKTPKLGSDGQLQSMALETTVSAMTFEHLPASKGTDSLSKLVYTAMPSSQHPPAPDMNADKINKILTVDYAVCASDTIQCRLCASNLQFVLLPEAVIDLVAVSASYASHFLTGASMSSSDGKVAAPAFDARVRRHLQPLSVPNLGEEVKTKEEKYQSVYDSVVTQVILSKGAFSLPFGIQRMDISLNVENNHVWVPSDSRRGDAPMLCASCRLTGHLSVFVLDWEALERRAHVMDVESVAFPFMTLQLDMKRLCIGMTRGHVTPSRNSPQCLLEPVNIGLRASYGIVSDALHYEDSKPALHVGLDVGQMNILVYSDISAILAIVDNTIMPLVEMPIPDVDGVSVLREYSQAAQRSMASQFSRSGISGIAAMSSGELHLMKYRAPGSPTMHHVAPRSIIETLVYMGNLTNVFIRTSFHGIALNVVDDMVLNPANLIRLAVPSIIISGQIDAANGMSLKGEAIGSLEGEFFNPASSAWEPLLAYLTWRIKVSTPSLCNTSDKTLVWSLHGEEQYHAAGLGVGQRRDVSEISSARFDDDDNNDGNPVSIAVHIGAMNINMTSGLLECVGGLATRTLRAFHQYKKTCRKHGMSVMKADQGAASCEPRDFLEGSFLVENNSGVDFQYWTSDETEALYAEAGSTVSLYKIGDCDDSTEADRSNSCYTPYDPTRPLPFMNVRFFPQDGMIGSPGRNPENYPGVHNIATSDSGVKMILVSSGYAAGGRTGAIHLRAGSNIREALTTNLLSPNAPIIVEPRTEGSQKALCLRSTIRLDNSMDVTFRVALASGERPDDRVLRWETRLKAGSSVYIPYSLCTLPGCSLLYQPVLYDDDDCSGAESTSPQPHSPIFGLADVPLPGIFGVTDNAGDETSSEVFEIPLATAPKLLAVTAGKSEAARPQGVHRRRREVRHGVPTENYAHWLRFGAVGVVPATQSNNMQYFTNLSVTNSGVPTHLNAQQTTGMCLRTFTLTAPMVITNALACDVEIILSRTHSATLAMSKMDGESKHVALPLRNAPQRDSPSKSASERYVIRSGLSLRVQSFHPTDSVHVCIRLMGRQYVTGGSADRVSDDHITAWSSIFAVPQCKSKNTCSHLLYADVPTENSAALTVHVDVADKDGCRDLTLFTPFWIISNPSHFLEIKHATDYLSFSECSTPKRLNGKDGLAADQVYVSDTVGGSLVARTRHSSLPRGFGKAKGVDGIILGPQRALRGLTDILSVNADENDCNVISRSNAQQVDSVGGLAAEEEPRRRASGGDAPTNHGVPSGTSNAHAHLAEEAKELLRCVQMSYTNFEDSKTSIRLRCRAPASGSCTAWSNPVDVNERTTTDVSVDGQFFVLMRKPLNGVFKRTQEVTVREKFIIVNKLSCPLQLYQSGYQSGSSDVCTIARKDRQPWHWPSAGEKLLTVKLPEAGWTMSRAMSIHKKARYNISLRNEAQKVTLHVAVTVDIINEQHVIQFSHFTGFMPYRLENTTLEVIRYRQVGTTTTMTLAPHHKTSFILEDPSSRPHMALELYHRNADGKETWIPIGTYSLADFNLQVAENLAKANASDHAITSHLSITVVLDKAVRVMKVLDERRCEMSFSSMQQTIRTRRRSDPVDQDDHTMVSESINVSLFVQSIAVSLVNRDPVELLYASISGIHFDYVVNTDATDLLEVYINHIQVDNQLWAAYYPSVFYPLPQVIPDVDGISARALKSVPSFISCSMMRELSDPTVENITSVSIIVLPFDVNIEGTLIAKLVNMAIDTVPYFQLGDHTSNADERTYLGNHASEMPPGRCTILQGIAKEIRKVKPRSSPNTQTVLIQNMKISEIRLNLSVNPTIQDLRMREADSLLYGFVKRFLLALVTIPAKIDNCLLSFNEFRATHTCVEPVALCITLGMSYVKQALTQLYVVLGSFEVIGNPVEAVSTVGYGVKDFIQFPTRGLFISPYELAMGFCKGSLSLCAHTVASVFSSASHLASLGLTGMDALCLAETTDSPSSSTALTIVSTVSQLRRPMTLLEGFAMAFENMCNAPRAGFRRDGVRGLAFELVRSGVGLGSIPFYGLLQHSISSMNTWSSYLLPRMQANMKKHLARVRAPLIFRTPNLPMQIYLAGDNVGQDLLSHVNGGEYKDEVYMCHTKLSDGTVLILSRTRLLLLRASFGQPEICWETELKDILSLDIAFDRSSMYSNNLDSLLMEEESYREEEMSVMQSEITGLVRKSGLRDARDSVYKDSVYSHSVSKYSLPRLPLQKNQSRSSMSFDSLPSSPVVKGNAGSKADLLDMDALENNLETIAEDKPLIILDLPKPLDQTLDPHPHPIIGAPINISSASAANLPVGTSCGDDTRDAAFAAAVGAPEETASVSVASASASKVETQTEKDSVLTGLDQSISYRSHANLSHAPSGTDVSGINVSGMGRDMIEEDARESYVEGQQELPVTVLPCGISPRGRSITSSLTANALFIERMPSSTKRLLSDVFKQSLASLQGSVKLTVYHMPKIDSSSKGSRKKAGVPSAHLLNDSVAIQSHLDTLELLGHLLQLMPSLFDEAIDEYLRACGVKVSLPSQSAPPPPGGGAAGISHTPPKTSSPKARAMMKRNGKSKQRPSNLHNPGGAQAGAAQLPLSPTMNSRASSFYSTVHSVSNVSTSNLAAGGGGGVSGSQKMGVASDRHETTSNASHNSNSHSNLNIYSKGNHDYDFDYSEDFVQALEERLQAENASAIANGHSGADAVGETGGLYVDGPGMGMDIGGEQKIQLNDNCTDYGNDEGVYSLMDGMGDDILDAAPPKWPPHGEVAPQRHATASTTPTVSNASMTSTSTPMVCPVSLPPAPSLPAIDEFIPPARSTSNE